MAHISSGPLLENKSQIQVILAFKYISLDKLFALKLYYRDSVKVT